MLTDYRKSITRPFMVKLFVFMVVLNVTRLAVGQDWNPEVSSQSAPLTDIKPTEVIHWSPVSSESKGFMVTIGLRLKTLQGFTLYIDKVKFEGPPGAVMVDLEGPATKTIKDPYTDSPVEVYSSGDFVVRFNTLEPFQEKHFPIGITFLGCTESICLFPYTVQLDVPNFVSLGSTSDASEQQEHAGSESLGNQMHHKDALAETVTESTALGDFEQSYAEQVKKGALGFGAMLLILFLGGLATNLTPCVFPMIPITLRILGKQSKSSWRSALAYALGIVGTYTSLGIVASVSGGIFGGYSGGTAFNLIFGVLFVLFALGMLGVGNFTFLQNLGAKLGSRHASMGNTILMGAGAGLVAAPCTGPILGGLLAYTADIKDPFLVFALFLVYSVGFALPYVFLGGFAASVSAIRLDAKIQVGVKLLFSSVLFALAFYYLRIPAREILEFMQGYWFGAGVILSSVGVIATLLVLLRQKTSLHAVVGPCIVLGLGFFSFVQNLSGLDQKSEIKWIKSLEEGLALSAKEQKPIILDGWADWCAACKKMDVTTYQDPGIKEELSHRWVAVKIDFTTLTDDLETFATKYEMQGLPVTILIPPHGDLSGRKRLTGYLSAETLLKELTSFEAKKP